MVQIVTKTGTTIDISADDNQVHGFVRATLAFKGTGYTGTIDGLTDCRLPSYSSSPLAATIRANGGTHAAKFVGRAEGQSKATTATLVLDEAAATTIEAVLDEANRGLRARKEAQDAGDFAAAAKDCPAGWAVAKRRFGAMQLCDDMVETLGGVVLGLGIHARDTDHGRYVYVMADRVAAAETRHAGDVASVAKRQEALLAEVIPPQAVQAWQRYSGDAESAWRAEDEQAWALIRKYGDAIQAQGDRA